MNTLNFTNGVATLDVDTLRNTTRYEMANGRLPRNRPIEHFQLLDELCEVADRHGLNPAPGTVYAAERQALRLNWKGQREDCPVQNFLLQRIGTTVHLNRNNEDGRNMGIALGYHERGLTLAFGLNVWMCGNMQIFGQHRLHTYGPEKVSYDDMMKLFGNWMQQFPERRALQMDTADELSRYEIGPAVMDETIGELFRMAVNDNNGHAQLPAPLNQAQVADLVKASHDELYQTDRPLTAYDLVQWGTHYLKPQRSDLVTLIDHTHRFCTYVAEKFSHN